jgi:hypothetical protein
MRNLHLVVLFQLIFISFSTAQTSGFKIKSTKNNAPSGGNAVVKFVENKNQWDKSVKYRADLPGGFLFLKDNSLTYAFYDVNSVSAKHPGKNLPKKGKNNASKEKFRATPDEIKAHSIDIKFLKANPYPITTIQASKSTSELKNYFLGNNPQNWASGVKSYQMIEYQELYNDINLKFYEENQTLKYEFKVAPSANPLQIQIQYQGAESIRLEDGQLKIKTSINEFIEKKPYSYQIIDDEEVSVPTNFKLTGDIITFEFPQGYDKTQPLIIDPELVFSTYSGSTADNWGSTATYDDQGNLYSAGIVFATGFPVRPNPGAFQISFAGSIDVGLLKFNADGSQLLYATYLGGTSAEFPHSLVVNKNRELVIFGTTSSTNFPTTTTAFDPSFNGGFGLVVLDGIFYNNGSDIFISKLSEDGKSLQASTYVGGSNNDGIDPNAPTVIANYGDEFRGEVITDDNNNIYVSSLTYSSNFPMQNAFKPNLEGATDGLLMKFNPDLTTLVWSTYFGGTNFDACFSMKLNAQGDIYVSGVTQSRDLRKDLDIATPIPHLADFQDDGDDDEDGFLGLLDNNGNFKQITYIGTFEADQTYLMDIDPEGNILTIGLSLGNYPVLNANYTNPNSHQFIQKLSADLTQSLMSTVVGTGRGAPDITPTAFMVNECGNIYLSGWGSSFGGITNLTTAGLPTTSDAFQRTTDGSDFYIMILEKNANSLLYATFFGGNRSNDHVDGGTSRFDKAGVIYHAACASCGINVTNDFPTTPSVWSRVDRSQNCNNAAFKFDIGQILANFDIFDAELNTLISSACRYPIDVKFSFRGSGAVKWTWKIDGVVVSEQREFIHKFVQDGVYTISLTAENPISCLKSVTVEKKLPVTVLALSLTPNTTICLGEPLQLQAIATKEAVYNWTPTRGLDNNRIPNPVANPNETTTYRVVAVDQAGCRVEGSVEVKVVPKVEIDFEVNNSSDCGKPSLISFKNKSKGADNYIWTLSTGQVFTTENPDPIEFNQGGKVVITLSAANEACQEILSKEIEIENNIEPVYNVITPNKDDDNENFELPNRQNYKLEIYDRWGGLVYRNERYQNEWGANAKAGIYYYVLTSPLGVVCKGWVEVIK